MKRLIFLMLALLVAGSASAATKVQVMTDGVIDVDRLPTISFFQEADPAAPGLGQIWWNNATNQLKVAGALGIYEFNATSIVAWDTTPEAFSFTDVTNATTNSTYTSAPIMVAGTNHPAPISVSGDASAKYSVNNATATAVNGTVAAGDQVRAVVTSSASDEAAVNATVTIGGVSDAFGVTTAASGSVTYLIDEDFEGTGAPSGWTADTSNGITVNWDSAVSPLAGDQSVVLTGNSGYGYISSPVFSGNDTTAIEFMFKPGEVPNFTAAWAVIQDGSGNGLVRIQTFDATGKISASFAPFSDESIWTHELSAATAHTLKVVYTRGTGADAELEIYALIDDEWTSILSMSGGATTAAAGRVLFLAPTSGSGTFAYDNIKVY